jgi:predicted transcriptional regulator
MPCTLDANQEKNLVNVTIYLNTTPSRVNESYILKISPDGNVSPKTQFDKDWEMFTGMDGVLYIGMHVDAQNGGMMTEEVTAMDLSDGKVLWKYRIPTGDALSSTLAATSAGVSIPSRDTLPHHITFDPPLNTTNDIVPAGYVGDWLGTGAKLCAGDGVIYVYFDSFRIEWPPRYSANYSYVKGVYGVNYTYVRGVYALDTRGRLLWQKPEDSPVTSMVVNNSTVFYGTKDGKISSTSIELAAGLTLAALSYIFVRFFLLGAVSRARDRLGINRNRNSVLEYVRAHPASTLGDISNGLGMNIGTVRYHILIMWINHRVVSMRADDRFVRYFTNSGSYSKEQQLVLSLLKRDGARKVLNQLLERPGISNAELSKCLNVSEVAVSKSIRVLLEKGIVVKEPVDGKTNAYFIDKKYTEPIASAMERTGSQQ